MAGCPSHLIQFRLPCAPHKRRRKTIRRLKVLEKNQTKICRFFTRIGNHSFTDFHRLPGTVEVKSCPADTQRSQEENKLSYRRHSQWMRTWMDTRLHQDPKHKRSLDLTTNRSSVSKRRLTFAELEPHAEDVGKENAIVGLFTRHRRPQEPGGFPPNMQRQKLCEIPRPQTEWNKQSNVPTSTSGSQKVDAQCSCTVEKVIQLDLLSLSDDKRVAQARSAWSRKHAKSIPSTLEVVPVQTREHALRVCENTRLLGTMFHYPVSATLLQDSERSTPTHRGSEGSRLNSHIRTRNTLSFWLPRSPVDDVRLDEFHQNHERIFRYIYARDLELTSHYNANFLKQNGLTPDIRATLADWMIKVQQYLKLRTETLHLAVSLVDRYTWLRSGMNPANYQLVGITSLFVAAKFVERFAPTTATLCYLTENSYKPRQVLDFEVHLLQTLGFEVAIPLPHHFLVRATLACTDLSAAERAKVELICCYLFELSLTEVTAVGVPASLRCAAAVRLVRQLIGLEQTNGLRTAAGPECSTPCSISFTGPLEEWPDFMCRSAGHEDTPQLRAMCSVYMRALMRFRTGTSLPNEKYEAAFHKFSNRGYKSIAQCSTVQQSVLDSNDSYLCTPSSLESTG